MDDGAAYASSPSPTACCSNATSSPPSGMPAPLPPGSSRSSPGDAGAALITPHVEAPQVESPPLELALQRELLPQELQRFEHARPR